LSLLGIKALLRNIICLLKIDV